MASLNQYGIVVMALLLGGGFAFGGIASYSGLVNTGSNNQQEFNASMPSQNYQETPYDMSLREQRVLAYNRDIVFVNAFYETEDQRSGMQNFQQLAETFDDRVYVSVANSSANSDIMIAYGLVDFPAAVVMGGGGATQTENVTVESVSQAVCDSFRSLGKQSAQCL
jgi:ABC-type Fe3+-hydroxamate transport system substrate-binding protein